MVSLMSLCILSLCTLSHIILTSYITVIEKNVWWWSSVLTRWVSQKCVTFSHEKAHEEINKYMQFCTFLRKTRPNFFWTKAQFFGTHDNWNGRISCTVLALWKTFCACMLVIAFVFLLIYLIFFLVLDGLSDS